MNHNISTRLVILLLMLFGALSAGATGNRFYVRNANFEPGEKKPVVCCLDNSQEFFGFQAHFVLPEGLHFVANDNKPDFTLSSRVNSSYSVVNNLISDTEIIIGAFSLDHSAITGDTGALFTFNVQASDTFTGGALFVKDIIFTDAANCDVEFPMFTLQIRDKHEDRFYIPDFEIEAGATKEVSIMLDNETDFTAFQTDIYLPDGISFVEHSVTPSGRAGNHAVTYRLYEGGAVRIVCSSSNNDLFSGYEGDLISFQVSASRYLSGDFKLELRNQRFSTADAKEYIIPDSSTKVMVKGNVLKGDVDRDGKISIVDVTRAISLQINNEPVDDCLDVIDMNDDGKFTVVDITSILNIILNTQ